MEDEEAARRGWTSWNQALKKVRQELIDRSDSQSQEIAELRKTGSAVVLKNVKAEVGEKAIKIAELETQVTALKAEVQALQKTVHDLKNPISRTGSVENMGAVEPASLAPLAPLAPVEMAPMTPAVSVFGNSGGPNTSEETAIVEGAAPSTAEIASAVIDGAATSSAAISSCSCVRERLSGGGESLEDMLSISGVVEEASDGEEETPHSCCPDTTRSRDMDPQSGSAHSIEGTDDIEGKGAQDSESLPEDDALFQLRDIPKKLLVLDLNGLLLFREYKDTPSGAAPRLPSNHETDSWKVWYRPHAHEFLWWCVQHFHVVIWSGARRKNIRELLEVFCTHKVNDTDLTILSETECTKTDVQDPQKPGKVLSLKELDRLWSKWEWRERGPFDDTNTLMIDDSPYKALLNAPYTSIHPRSWTPFSASDENDNDLAPDNPIREFLRDYAQAPDGRVVVGSWQNHAVHDAIEMTRSEAVKTWMQERNRKRANSSTDIPLYKRHKSSAHSMGESEIPVHGSLTHLLTKARQDDVTPKDDTIGQPPSLNPRIDDAESSRLISGGEPHRLHSMESEFKKSVLLEGAPILRHPKWEEFTSGHGDPIGCIAAESWLAFEEKLVNSAKGKLTADDALPLFIQSLATEIDIDIGDNASFLADFVSSFAAKLQKIPEQYEEVHGNLQLLLDFVVRRNQGFAV